MKIAAVTMVYNEALILPYYLRHYRYLDEIHILYETDSTDESLEILSQAPNVIVEKCHIEGGIDDIEKVKLINRAVQSARVDWVYVVDPDEFVFPPNETPRDFLARQTSDVVRSTMFQVYRHRTDRDLDPSLPPVPQRLHGDPIVLSTETEANRAPNSVYVKPNVVRPSRGISFLPGHHQIERNPRVSFENYVGAHWQMADPSIAVRRRLERRARMSGRNRAYNMGWQNYTVTGDWIRSECERHMDDPVIDELRSFNEEQSQQNAPVQAGTAASRARGSMYAFNPLEHPICLSSPRRRVPFMSWRQHVPFAMLLVDLLKPKVLVELGVHHGDSYCAFCQAVAELRLKTACYGVDTWKGDPHASFYGPEVLADLTAHHDPLYGGFSCLIQSTFDEARKHFADGTVDILHIDGYHTYDAVKHDFETWLPKVSRRGVVLLHDINEKQSNFGAWRVWDEIKGRHPHFEFLHCHGLGIVAVGQEPPEELGWLLGASEERVAAIRGFFFCLGERLTGAMSSQATAGPVIDAAPSQAILGPAAASGPDLGDLRAVRAELEAIRGSVFFQVAWKLRSLVNVALPVGTRRRAIAKGILDRVRGRSGRTSLRSTPESLGTLPPQAALRPATSPSSELEALQAAWASSELEALQAAWAELQAIRGSTIFQIAWKLRSLVNVALPVGTRRRIIAKGILDRVRSRAAHRSRYPVPEFPSGKTQLARKYLRGVGLAIGSLDPALGVPPNVSVDRVPIPDYEDLSTVDPLEASSQGPSKHTKGRRGGLAGISDEAYDFVVCHQLPANSANPMEALQALLRVVRTGGILFLTVPNGGDLSKSLLDLLSDSLGIRIVDSGIDSADGNREQVFIVEKADYVSKISHMLRQNPQVSGLKEECTIHVVVPIHNAHEDLERCLYSVFRHQDIYRIILIDDGSTDKITRQLLATLQQHQGQRFEIARNDKSIGYLKTANRGMKMAGGDVILLNSDTIVTSGWAKKMRECAYLRDRIATVTPFTNNGTECSIPEFGQNNEIPEGFTIDGFAELVERVSVNRYPDLVTGIGFCMYVRRAVIDEIGYLDEENFDQGYGEENDFSMRAMRKGYKNVLCDNTFIFHRGAASFGRARDAYIASSHVVLEKMYPEFWPAMHLFWQLNPHKELQDNVKRAAGLIS